MVLRSDYIMRLIQQLTVAFAKVMGLRRAGKMEDARQVLKQTGKKVLGIDLEVLKALEPEAAASSASPSAKLRKSAPAPPYFSGNGNPIKPNSPICLKMSAGNWSVSSISRARGAISPCANSRTTLRIIRCSVVRSKPILKILS